MAITGNPGDLATGGYGTGISGRAATSRDVANAVSRGEAMAGARSGGEGPAGAGFRGPTSTWGSAQSVVPGSALSQQLSSPLSPYRGLLNVTQDDLVNAAVSNAPFFGGTVQNPSLGMLQQMGAQIQASPQLQGVLGSIYGPFMQGGTPTAVPSGLLNNALSQALPASTSATQPTAAQNQDMGPLSDYAISEALGYQNTPFEDDIAYLASRVGPTASPEALSLVDPTFVTELARELRTAEEATGTTAKINDLYRSPDTQGQLYAELKAKDPNYMVAPAGASWHQAAVAADIARSPVLNYMRANTPASLNFPYGQSDLVHVQLSNPAMLQAGVNKGTRSAFSSTMADSGSMFGVGDMGQVTPSAVAAGPSPAPVRAVMPQQPTNVAFNQPLAPRTPTPNILDRVATNVFGIPGYDTGPGLLSGATKAGEYGTQLLANSQPQVVNPASSALEAPPVRRPTGAPTSLASLLFDRAISRGNDRRKKKATTTTAQTMNDTIGGLLA